VAVLGTSPDFGSGRCDTLGRSATVADCSSFSLSSLVISGSCGGDAGVIFPLSLVFAFDWSPKMESLSSLMEEALLIRPDCPSSAARRSFSRRVSRPRLWQYQNTNSSTKVGQLNPRRV
jgi:hypothetical protein